MGMLSKAGAAHEEPAKEKHKKAAKQKRTKSPRRLRKAMRSRTRSSPRGSRRSMTTQMKARQLAAIAASRTHRAAMTGSQTQMPTIPKQAAVMTLEEIPQRHRPHRAKMLKHPTIREMQVVIKMMLKVALLLLVVQMIAVHLLVVNLLARPTRAGAGGPQNAMDYLSIPISPALKEEYMRCNAALYTALYKNDKLAQSVMAGIVPGPHKIESVAHMSLILFQQINKQLKFVKETPQVVLPFARDVVEHVLDLAVNVKKLPFTDQESQAAVGTTLELVQRIVGVSKGNIQALKHIIPRSQLQDAKSKYDAHLQYVKGVQGPRSPDQGPPAAAGGSPGGAAAQGGPPGGAPPAGGAPQAGPTGGEGGTPGGQPQPGAPVTAAPGPGQSAPPGGMLTQAAQQPPGQ